jgi:DUF4097 and DUF4098 domain-containing protein YvlB
MCAERRKVLELLAQGKITADEAEKLLNKLDSLSGSQAEPESTTSESKATETKPLRFLRVEVEKPGSTENVNVRIPLSFLRASAGLHVLLPRHVQERLSANGIDIGSLSRLRGQELEKALQQLDVHVDESSGKKVRIFCE